MANIQVITPDFINVQISTSKNDGLCVEKRFSKALRIEDLKKNLELITGGNCATMKLEVYSKDNNLICILSDDGALLGSYPVDSGMRLHVNDQFLLQDEFDKDGEKYNMTDDDYSKMDSTVRSFLMRNKQGKYSAEYLKKKELEAVREKEMCENKTIGSRCKVQVKDMPTRLGTVMYSGEIEGLQGYWVGVKYDEPLGKNDGTCKGKRYFECPDKYGAFVKPQDVICGDFPPEDYDLDEEL